MASFLYYSVPQEPAREPLNDFMKLAGKIFDLYVADRRSAMTLIQVLPNKGAAGGTNIFILLKNKMLDTPSQHLMD